MKDQPKKLVLPISGPSPRRSSRTAWARAVAAVAAGGLLLTVSASVPVPHVLDDDRGRPIKPHEVISSVPVGKSETVLDDVSLDQIVAVVVVQRPDQRQGLSLRDRLLSVDTDLGGSVLGYANGRIPAAVLCPLEFAPGHLLRCDAAERLTALSDVFEREFGYPIPITDSYRSYVQQVAVASAKPHLAAIPGTSNHGWGIAVDLGGRIAGGASAEYVWLRVHGPDFGWDNPPWARLGGAKPEPWHFEFFAAGSVPNRAIDPSDVGAVGPDRRVWAPPRCEPRTSSTPSRRTTSPRGVRRSRRRSRRTGRATTRRRRSRPSPPRSRRRASPATRGEPQAHDADDRPHSIAEPHTLAEPDAVAVPVGTRQGALAVPGPVRAVAESDPDPDADPDADVDPDARPRPRAPGSRSMCRGRRPARRRLPAHWPASPRAWVLPSTMPRAETVPSSLALSPSCPSSWFPPSGRWSR